MFRFRHLPLALLLIVIIGCNDETDSRTTRLDTLFDRLVEHGFFHGVALVAEGDQILFTTARGAASLEWGISNEVETRFRIASLSKQFAATIVLQLVGEGRLALDDALDDHLDGLPPAWADVVTIRQVLDQTSGIPNYTLLPDYLDVVSKKRFTRDEFFDLVCADPLFVECSFTPGSSWEYSNTNYFLLGVLAERAAGEPYETLVQQRIFDPLRMRDSGVCDSLKPVPMLAAGYETTMRGDLECARYSEVSPKSVPSGGLYSTVHDLLKWSRALDDGALLAADLMQVMTTPSLDLGDGLGYACGNWREVRENGNGEEVEIFAHGGSAAGISTWLVRVPSQRRCVILLHNAGSGRETALEKIATAALDILDGGTAELPRFDLIGALASTYFSHREALVEHYHLLREHHAGFYDFSPEALSQIGHLLIEAVADDETALVIFRLNAEQYPDSPLARADLDALVERLDEGAD